MKTFRTFVLVRLGLARSADREQEEPAMWIRLRIFLAAAMILSTIGVTTDAWAIRESGGLTPFNNEGMRGDRCEFGNLLAVNTAQLAAAAQLLPPARDRFRNYQEKRSARVYRAFAIESASGKWGQGMSSSWPEIAIEKSLEDCRRRAARDCEIYAVGDMVVHGLADWKVQVAAMLYLFKRSATGDDLEAINSKDSGPAIAALKRSLLLVGARRGSAGTVAAMLDRGIDVDATTDVGVTALSYAASRARLEVVALLLKRGAKVNLRNDAGMTALGIALLAKRFVQPHNFRVDDHHAVIRLLKDAGGAE